MFFFDVYEDGREIGRDNDGTELPGIEQARHQAALALADLAKDAVIGTARIAIWKSGSGTTAVHGCWALDCPSASPPISFER